MSPFRTQFIFSPIRTTVLLAVCLLAIQSATAQSPRISLSGRMLTYREAFRQIEAQTNLVIGVSSRLLDDTKNVTVSKPSGSTAEVLTSLLQGTGLTYSVNGRLITLAPNPNPAPVQPSATAPAQAQTSATPARDGTTAAQRSFEPAAQPAEPISQPFTVQPAGASPTESPTALPQANTNAPSVRESAPDPRRYEALALYDRHEDRGESRGNPVSGRAGVKTNLLYWATTTPNAAVEFSLAPKWSFELGGGVNLWNWNNGMSLRHFLVQPEGRYWFCRAFEGHFVGLHGIYGRYNAGDLPFGSSSLREHMYHGWGAGAGISYGYHFSLGRRWGLELTVGAGYVYLNYEKYNCEGCRITEGNFKRHYIGPTRAGINLIYMIR